MIEWIVEPPDQGFLWCVTQDSESCGIFFEFETEEPAQRLCDVLNETCAEVQGV